MKSTRSHPGRTRFTYRSVLSRCLLLGAALTLTQGWATSKAVADDTPDADKLARWLVPQSWTRDTDGPILELGQPGQFDDTHLLTPLVALENGTYRMWYSGSRDRVDQRVFRLGLATSRDGRRFKKYAGNPIFEFGDGKHSILTPTLLRDPSGAVLRENGKLRMWLSAADLTGSGEHTLHESSSQDGLHWTPPSAVQLRNVYAPTVIKENGVYRMWYIDVSASPWSVRHATSRDGTHWDVSPQICLTVDQPWEAGNLFYPTVLKIDGVYLIWYGSYWRDHPHKTALGFAVSADGLTWKKNPHNPVFRPDPMRLWESHYTTSQSVMRLPDGSWRIWYSSRKAPPHVNKYFAMGTARWPGPEWEPDDESNAKDMPNPAQDREAFTNWQRQTRSRLTRMLGVPRQHPDLAAESRGQLEHDGLVLEKWVFTSEPGSRIPAVLYRKKGRKDKMPAVVLTYGHGGSKSQPAYQYIAQLYAKMGVAVLAIDPLGEEERNVNGKLGTRAHDPRSVHERAWRAGRPILGKLVWDAMRGVDFLLARDDIDPDRIGVAGNSLGGALAGWMAVLEPRLHWAIVSGWAFDDATLHFGKYCTRVPNERMRRMCTWPQYLALAAPHCSILVMNGDADTIIDRRDDGSAWRGTRANVKQAAKTYHALGNPEGITPWFEPHGGHRPYPAHPAALKWLVPRLRPAGWTEHDAAQLEDVNFGDWAKRYGIRFERLYGTPLHLKGATVTDMDIRPLKTSDLACLREEEKGSPDFTLQGWLARIESTKSKSTRDDSPKVDPSKQTPKPKRSSNPKLASKPKQTSKQMVARLEKIVPRLMKKHNTPGVSIALVERRKIVWQKGFGVQVAGGGEPVDSQTVFEACSMSKPVFALAVMKLVESGQLDLDRPLAEYFAYPDLADQSLHKKITARMVLTHTSGLPNWRKGGWRSGGPLPILFEPGARFQYSGEGMLYLQRVVESTTGEPLDAWMQKTVLRPLGMTHSGYAWREDLAPRVAAGHDEQGEVKTHGKRFTRPNAAYTLLTTPGDYARFAIAMMGGPSSAGGEKATPADAEDASAGASFTIERALLDPMLTPAVKADKPNQWRSVGWVVTKTPDGSFISHSGANGTGFRCHCRFWPADGSAIVIMTNALGGRGVWEEAVAAISDDSTTTDAAAPPKDQVAEAGGPASKDTAPSDRRGALVICGGGKLPNEILDRYMKLAGGRNARLVIITTAQENADKSDPNQVLKPWRERRPASAVVLHTRDRHKADSDAFVQPLCEATGVWFLGGQQSRLADAYLGTAVERQLAALLQRGGVIGGTSAGAAIQSRVMIASGNPKPKVATGFDLLPGAIVDQHFSQRKRRPRLIAALKQNPKLLGVGVDENTALVYRRGVGEVLGKHAVHILDPSHPDAQETPSTLELRSGARYDFRRRAVP